MHTRVSGGGMCMGAHVSGVSSDQLDRPPLGSAGRKGRRGSACDTAAASGFGCGRKGAEGNSAGGGTRLRPAQLVALVAPCHRSAPRLFKSKGGMGGKGTTSPFIPPDTQSPCARNL